MYTLQNFSQVMDSLFEPTLLKVVAAIIISFGFFFGDLYTAGVIAIMMLLIFDTVLGVWATWYEGNAITSRRFSRVVVKSIVYLIAISAGHFVDDTIPGGAIQGTVIAFVAITEFISILENAGRLGIETPKKLLNQLKEFRSEK